MLSNKIFTIVRALGSKIGETTSLFEWATEATIGDEQDCTSILETAAKEVNAVGGGAILLPNYSNGEPLRIALDEAEIPEAVSITSPTANLGCRLNTAGMPGTLIRVGGTGYAIRLTGIGAVVAGVTIAGTGANAGAGIFVEEAAWQCKIKDVGFDQLGNQAIVTQPGVDLRGLRIDNIYAVNCMLLREREEEVGVVDLSGTDHWIYPSEITASMSAMANDDPMIWALILRDTNNHVMPGVLVEFAEGGLLSMGFTNEIDGVRSDYNLTHGFAGPGRYQGCASYNNAVSNSGSGFTSLGGQHMHLHDCANYGEVEYAFDFLGSEYDDEHQRGSVDGCKSLGHTIAQYRFSTVKPTPIGEPLLRGPTALRPTETWAGRRFYDTTLGREIIRNGADNAWVGLMTEAL